MTDEQRRALRVDHVERHRSMARCLDWSFELLEEPMQEGFVRLGVFADTFTAESVKVVCDVSDAEALLDRLQDASLIRRIEVDRVCMKCV